MIWSLILEKNLDDSFIIKLFGFAGKVAEYGFWLGHACLAVLYYDIMTIFAAGNGRMAISTMSVALHMVYNDHIRGRKRPAYLSGIGLGIWKIA